MKKYLALLAGVVILLIFQSLAPGSHNSYQGKYRDGLMALEKSQRELLASIGNSNLSSEAGKLHTKQAILAARTQMKQLDFWLRYLEPTAYRLINAPLPVEWETEVFEKFEKPYKRIGGGLTLAWLLCDENETDKEKLSVLIDSAIKGCTIFLSDSVGTRMNDYHHFYLCNRLFLLNLAAIYTSGFECPEPTRVIPELKIMLGAVREIYASYNAEYPKTALPATYLERYDALVKFAQGQPDEVDGFDHYTFVRDHVNPLFALNQTYVLQYGIVSRSMIDFSLNKKAGSIFDKQLYTGQNAKGIFRRVTDSTALAEIEETGRLLFYDPILSGNNQRSCASCHNPEMYFTDTSVQTALHYDQKTRLARNTPTLLNAGANHLLMADGSHFTAENQVKGVIGNASEMGCDAKDAVRKVMSCSKYRKALQHMMAHTPQETEVTMDHIASCISWYYSKFSKGQSRFDNAMNARAALTAAEQRGYNLFMGKAQCATCHFVPQFNGVKPPYIGSEFEVLGIPADKQYSRLSSDSGRYIVNPADETLRAFRTGTVRNASRTAPYMHNGVFGTLREVIDFYDAGGGAGHGIDPGNQTLAADSLHLTNEEKDDIIAFINSLEEDIPTAEIPVTLPSSKLKVLRGRKPRGIY